MSNPDLPDEHHFARQSTGKQGRDFSDEQDGYHDPPWLNARAFQPSPDNPHISGLWVERIADTWANQLERIRTELKESSRNVKKSYQFAIIKVEKIKELGRRFSRDLHVVHAPDEKNHLPSHSEIRGIAPEDEALQQKLADNAQVEPIFPDP
jgi:hypothetical protein